ncbi:hypothetical protein ABZ766_25845 [Streptomyces sp. NPDC006670]|uniref:hypothetical protein n=1 Tax=Streptomyces sp. NPDC006670 TaxID=3154476 RepID=UPI0033FAAE00
MDAEATPPGIGEGPAKVISVSLPEGTVHALRSRVGARGVSAMVAAAIEQHLRNQVLDEYLTEYQEEFGAFTEEERRQADAVWASAEEAEAAWRHRAAG